VHVFLFGLQNSCGAKWEIRRTCKRHGRGENFITTTSILIKLLLFFLFGGEVVLELGILLVHSKGFSFENGKSLIKFVLDLSLIHPTRTWRCGLFNIDFDILVVFRT